ncbi:IS1634 family transposase [Gemmatimonadota bacterium]
MLIVVLSAYTIVTMYLRTSTRKNRDGSLVSYLQIAENTWDPVKKRSVTKVHCTLGRADGKATERLKQLAASIRRHAELETVAELAGDLQFVNSWPYGSLYVLEHLWEELGIGKVIRSVLKGQGRKVPLETSLFAMVANRALAPTSKLGCYERWLAEDVWYPAARELELHHLYRAMDLLAEHKERLEEELFWHIADLLSVDLDLIFYDTTSVGFSVDEEDALRRRGYARKGGEGDPQIVVGLALTRDGYPVRSWVFEGNTVDVETIGRVREDLKGWRLSRCVWVCDAGMVSEQNLKTLSSGGGSYIVAMPARPGTEVVTEVLSRPGRFRAIRENLQIKEVRVGEGDHACRYVVCFNPQEAERQRHHRQEVLKELRAELRVMEGHPKKACKLLSSRRYGPYLRTNRNGTVVIDPKKVEARARRDGTWVLHTNDQELSAEDLALGYKQLMRIEQTWRTMKSVLRIRPVFHRTPERIRAHVYLCELALLLQRAAEAKTGSSWSQIRRELDSIKVGQLSGPQGTVWQTALGSTEARNLLRTLKLQPPPLILAAK